MNKLDVDSLGRCYEDHNKAMRANEEVNFIL